MFAVRLRPVVSGLVIAVAALAQEASAVEQAPAGANQVLVVGSAGTGSSSTGAGRTTAPSSSNDKEVAEEWTEPRRLLLGVAALFVFLAYRRRGIE